jgi:hypothetical protein
VGKTTLAIQLGLDTVVHNKDAAFLFVSLEMSRWEMLTRFRSRLANLDWKTLVAISAALRRAGLRSLRRRSIVCRPDHVRHSPQEYGDFFLGDGSEGRHGRGQVVGLARGR